MLNQNLPEMFLLQEEGRNMEVNDLPSMTLLYPDQGILQCSLFSLFSCLGKLSDCSLYTLGSNNLCKCNYTVLQWVPSTDIRNVALLDLFRLGDWVFRALCRVIALESAPSSTLLVFRLVICDQCFWNSVASCKPSSYFCWYLFLCSKSLMSECLKERSLISACSLNDNRSGLLELT